MEALTEELITILEQEIALYSTAKDAAVREQDILVNVRIDDLAGIIEEQEGLLVRLRELERRRLRKVIDLARALNLNLRGITISALSRSLPEEHCASAQRLSAKGKELRALMEEFGAINEDNNRLIKSSMSFLDSTMRESFKGDRNPIVYSQKGKLSDGEEEKKRVIFVNRKV
jgi:flagellar biosynthesis/type III secretory pathway chaperone